MNDDFIIDKDNVVDRAIPIKDLISMLKHDKKRGKDLVFLYNIEDYFRKYSDIYTKKKMYSRRACRARYIGGKDEQRRPSCTL
ncbi:MAG: hypothetical protein LIR46_08030 [Bacteroidota bacterium]|nr:hypothetical protein [Bacteroidota bacterium]